MRAADFLLYLRYGHHGTLVLVHLRTVPRSQRGTWEENEKLETPMLLNTNKGI